MTANRATTFQTEGIDHVALTVHDVARSVEWYTRVLGLDRRFEEAWGDYPAVVGAGSTSIALFPLSGPSAQAPSSRSSIAMRHLAFRVDAGNFERARRELAAGGIAFEFQDHQIAHSIYFYDPDGHQIELTTYLDDDRLRTTPS
jgi:catechol 2,3-dioxygenase-like lactoylglutathione lyase family enzyme